jgi:hypothetical protein
MTRIILATFSGRIPACRRQNFEHKPGSKNLSDKVKPFEARQSTGELNGQEIGSGRI